MKIALIATEKLPVPSIRGGAIQIYLEAVAPIVAKKHTVTVISIKDPQLPEEETIDGVRYIRVDENQYKELVGKELEKESYDVVHLCNRPKWIAYLKESVPQARFILSVHNEMFAYGKISDEEGKKCIESVAQIVTVSAFIARTITDRFPEAIGKTQPVFSGVDLDTYHPVWTAEGEERKRELRERFGLEGKKIVLFVGRLSKVKGPHILLQALPEIIEKHPEMMFVVVGSKWFGDNNINNYVKHLYTLGAMYKDHVQFLKFIKPKEIPSLYAMSDIFVCSSQWQEPLARVHYEAMAAGLPIITSNRGGNPEVIDDGQNGYIVYDYENPSSYAQLINGLLDDENRRLEMGRNGRSVAEADFGWSRVANHLISVYEGDGIE